MPTNNTITQDEINQFKAYRDEIEDFCNGVDCQRRLSLYTPEELEKLRKQDRIDYWRKGQILISRTKFTPIRSIIGDFWPTTLLDIEEIRDKIETDIKDPDGNWMEIHGGRLRPNHNVSQGFLKLIYRLDGIIKTAKRSIEFKQKTEQPTEASGGELPEKPEENEQNTICAKIKSLFLELYEKTVKAFFDSVLGKWGTK